MSPKLNAAAFAGDLAEVDRLLASGADPSSKDQDGYTPLHEASQVGHVDIAKRLIAAGADVHARYKDGGTALHEAARYGQPEVCELLLREGAEIEAKGFEMRTPLHSAALHGHTSTVKLLLEAGADPNAKAQYCDGTEAARILEGATPLHLAAWSGHISSPEHVKPPGAYVGVAKLLLDAGADANAAERCIGSELGFINMSGGMKGSWDCRPAHIAGSPEMVRLLAEHGADLSVDSHYMQKTYPYSQRSDFGAKTPLQHSIGRKNYDVAAALLECGAIPNERDLKLLTPELAAELEAITLTRNTKEAAGAWRQNDIEDDHSEPMRVPSPDLRPLTRAEATQSQIVSMDEDAPMRVPSPNAASDAREGAAAVLENERHPSAVRRL